MYSIDLNQDVVSCTCFVINVMNIFTVTSVDPVSEWWYPTDTMDLSASSLSPLSPAPLVQFLLQCRPLWRL